MTSRHLPRLVTALALLAFGFAFVERAPEADAASLCGPLDRPETGIPGDVPLADQLSGRAEEGYSCGLSPVGHSSPGGRGCNANMALAGDCPYVAGDGIAVVDVPDPAPPDRKTTRL